MEDHGPAERGGSGTMRVLDVATLAQWVEAAPVNDSAQVGPDVVIDTRKVTPGALFIALPGTRVDGHDFTQAAQDMGAAAVLVTRRTDAQLPHLVVDDGQAGLSRLARHVVARSEEHTSELQSPDHLV